MFVLCGLQSKPGYCREHTQPTKIHIPQISTSDHWWNASPGTSWQWQLTGVIDTSYDVVMYDIDLFDASQETIDQLHSDGRIVICYFSAGSWENWRPDKDEFPAEVLGNNLEGWPDEKWLDIRALADLGAIMGERFDLAVQKDCDGVEPDNVDGYTNNSGFPLTYEDQINYNTWLAEQAHQRGLSVGLKNDLDQVNDLLAYFDWALNEECHTYNECSPFGAVHPKRESRFWGRIRIRYSLIFAPRLTPLISISMKKNWDLDAWREACR